MWFLFQILHVKGRNTFLCKGEMCFILLGGVLTSFFLYIGLVTMFTYIVLIFDIYIYIYDGVCLLHLPLHVLFLFHLYPHVSYSLYTIYYFYFTLRCRDEFCLKCFKNTGCQSLLAINSLFCKVFQEFMLGQILLYSTSKYELSDLLLLSYVHLIVVVLSRIAKWGDCQDICDSCQKHMSTFYVIV